jgi:hypothetical protein
LPPTPNNQLDRTTFNAIPIPAFVVNGDVQILDLNQAAAGTKLAVPASFALRGELFGNAVTE